MTRPLFRPPDFWKSAVMTLPDGSFFELLRSIFGNIKTPFNKQRLMADLAALLGREEIQKTIAAYIDEADARIIAAVAVLGEPAPGELETFFAGDLSYAAVHDLLLNLEERFIIYRFREEGVSRLALNPALAPVLAPLAANRDLLFPWVSPAAEQAEAASGPAAPPGPPADDRIIGGILAFVSGEARFFKAEGGLRKKTAGAGALVFPGFDLESLAGGLRLLGLIRPEGEALVPDGRRIAAFAERSPRERMEYWAAGIYCFLFEEAGAAASHLLRGRLRFLAELIHRLGDQIKPGRWYPPGTLYRYAGMLERQARPEGSAGGIRLDRLIALMETLGLLASPEPEYRAAGPLLSGPDGTGREGRTPGQGPALAMDSPFSCVLYPGAAFGDILKLADFLTVREAGAAVRFELTRESAVRGFDRGLDAAGMIALLERLSGNRISENLIWSLREWEKRYGDVNLRRGIVLTLSEDRRYLAEAEPVAALIRETLAPGVYLLAGTGMEEAAEALRKAGVDIIRRAGPGTGGLHSGGGHSGGGSITAFPALESLNPGDPDRTVPPLPPEGGAGREALKERFRGVLEKMTLSREERDELSARIDRRLVLSETQLEGASIRYEKLEARLLDYVGKAAIAKQAVSAKSPVEVTWPHPGKGTVQVRGIPEALEKNGGESILILKPLSPEQGDTIRIPGDTIRIPGDTIRIPGDTIRIPLGKISLLRRIKKSIFGD
jgi:hypothetical protein